MSQDNEEIFTAWLNSPECWQLLKKCAHNYCKKIADNPYTTLDPGKDEPDDFAAELWRLLRTRKGGLANKLALFLVREDWVALQRYLMSIASSSLREQNRDKYYQRVRQALSDAGSSLGYQATTHQTSYGSMTQEAIAAPPYASLVDEGWKPTFPAITTDTVKKAATITKLAKIFREQLERHLGKNVRVQTRELCAYIRDGWPAGTEYDIKETQIVQDDHGKPLSESDALTRADHSQSQILAYSQEWLQNFSDRIALYLDDKQLLILMCLRIYCDFTQKKVAQLLGLSGPSHVSYKMEQASNIINLFTSQEDRLSGEDLDENLYDIFLKMLLDNCKDEDCSRSYQEKDNETHEELL